jgi:hypothetical protein
MARIEQQMKKVES